MQHKEYPSRIVDNPRMVVIAADPNYMSTCTVSRENTQKTKDGAIVF